MAIPLPLPEKIEITRNVARDNLTPAAQARYDQDKDCGFEPDDLTPEARVKYDAYYTLKFQRKDPSQAGIAQDCLDCWEHLKANRISKTELHEVYGFSARSTLKPAQAEEKRIKLDLGRMASKDVAENPAVALKVADVKAKIVDFVEFKPKAVEPVPE